MKTLTRKQLESRKARAVRFLRDVKNDDSRADEIEDETLEGYADRRRIRLLNPKKKLMIGGVMPGESTKELKRQIRELKDENEELQSKLDAIADVVVPEETEEEEDDTEEDYEDED
jgi:hypothetical protein